MQMNILEAKNNLSQLIKSAQAGEEVVIANRGEPAVRLVPVNADSAASGKPGDPDTILAWLKKHRLPDYARRTHAQIEADIEDARNSWD